jgi:type II secretory pathway pseudopilin PulG
VSIGLALIVIFILYLIDKHNLWRQAAKILGGLIILAVLGVGAFYGWTKYDEYRTAKREGAQQATYQKSIQDCITRNIGAGPRDIFDQVSAQELCEKDPSTLPRCWSKPALPGGFQFDQNSRQDLNGKRIPPDSDAVCYPIALQSNSPNCKDGLVAGCVDNSPAPWKKYGPTRVYELEGKRYEVPQDTTLDELEAAIKFVSHDRDYAKASPEDQKGYLAFVIETNRKRN